jgi:hypothetical protein
MTDDEFWTIIAAAGQATDPTDRLGAELECWADDDVIDFDAHLHRRLRRCWTEELWQLAGLVVDGLDDATFEYFRLWLVFLGRTAFETVTTDPDRLAEVPFAPGGCQLDGPQFVAWRTYRSRTGEHMPARRQPPAHLRPLWATRSAVDPARRFPRTWAGCRRSGCTD